MKIYKRKPEIWNKERCKKESHHTASDGLGTKYPFKGYIGSHYGVIKYNGGCIREDELYDGEKFPFPVIHKDYEIVCVRTWGYRIKKIEK